MSEPTPAAGKANSLFGSEPETEESDEDVPWAARRILTRSDRALCRTLVTRHKFLPGAVSRRFGWPEKTIRKAVGNNYSPADNIKNDHEKLPADFETILNEMTAERGNADVKPAKHKLMPKPRPRAQAQVDRKPTIRQPNSANAPVVAAPPRGPGTSDEDFLRAFVAKVGLDPVWCRVLQSKGFTEDKLCRMAGIHTDKVTAFVSSTFPEMREIDRLLFVEAVGRLPVSVL
ncbi:hypothetical protein C8R44DRAFT_884931 [Mycena epipterygia]|nr:hypothetical protein C8R44DRAFT_884931 [Mycena epipterygia]